MLLAGHGGALATLVGETVAIAGLTTLLMQALAPPHQRWLGIGLRVGGSWITAAALLMLGWLVRHPPQWPCPPMPFSPRLIRAMGLNTACG